MFHLLALITVGGLFHQAQDENAPKVSLASYLGKHPWDPQKRGAMLVVAPASVEASTDGGGLASFERKEFAVGSISTIAPTQMVIIDASLADPPNLYDGLPRQDKVLYLMSLLDADQWKIASSAGIGMGDLRKDQQAVYRSILPTEFTYENFVSGPMGRLLPAPGLPPSVTLTREEEEQGVRLVFFKRVQLGVVVGENGRSAISPSFSDMFKEGTPMPRRKENTGEDQTSLYGVQIRKVLDNKQKPSQLDYRSHSLDGDLPLQSPMTITAICQSATAVSGLKILADLRIGSLPVQTFGKSARAGDVLKALALSVTGTFRQVGPCYILTSDLQGIGTKRLKIAEWSWELATQTRLKSKDWRSAIRATGGAHSVAYSPDTNMTVNDAMTKFMAGRIADGGSDTTMPVSQMPQEWQKVMDTPARFAGGLTMRKDVAIPSEQFFWTFALPDGRRLGGENRNNMPLDILMEPIGPDNPANATARGTSRNQPPKAISLHAGTGSALEIKTDDERVTTQLLPMAKAHGFDELWLQTWNSTCLQHTLEAAKGLGLSVRLVIKPWEASQGTSGSDLDRTILGMSFGEAGQMHEDTTSAQESKAFGFAPPAAFDNLMSPTSPRLADHWRQLAELAKTPGLAGTVLDQTEPPGYEPTVSLSIFQQPEFAQILNLGYNEALRAAFVAENMADPVDFLDTRLRIERLDLRLPFFGDPMELGSGSIESAQPKGAMVKWNQLRAETNRKAIEDLANQVPTPVLIQPRNTLQDFPIQGYEAFVTWQPGTALPMLNTPLFRGGSVAAEYWITTLGFRIPPAVSNRMFGAGPQAEPHAKLAVDVATTPIDQVSKLLDTFFQPVTSH